MPKYNKNITAQVPVTRSLDDNSYFDYIIPIYLFCTKCCNSVDRQWKPREGFQVQSNSRHIPVATAFASQR